MARWPSCKIEQAGQTCLHFPPAQHNEISACQRYCHVAFPDLALAEAPRSESQTISSFMALQGALRKEVCPEHKRGTVRRQVLHQFVQAGIVVYNPDHPNLPTNSPHAHYALTPEVLSVIQTYSDPRLEGSLQYPGQGLLLEVYLRKGRRRSRQNAHRLASTTWFKRRWWSSSSRGLCLDLTVAFIRMQLEKHSSIWMLKG